MLYFEHIKCQERPKRILISYLHKAMIPHALLFTGIEGVGKRTIAIEFAMLCNCLSKKNYSQPCRQCKSCKRISSGNHPDIILLEPSGAFIRISQIRELIQVLTLKPYEASIRVIVISNAHLMTNESSNALLKMLEEPPDRTLFILTALQQSDLLPTIISRCVHIRFNPVLPEIIHDILITNQLTDPKYAVILSIIASGSISKAMMMAKKNWMLNREWLIKELSILSSRPIQIRLALSEQLAKNKEIVSDYLEIMKMWFRDILASKYGSHKIINQDKVDQIHVLAKLLTVKSIHEKISAIYMAQRDIDTNANLRLTMDMLVQRLAGN